MDERIKKLRRALDLTQQELAERLGTAQSTVADYEKGRCNPSRRVVENICKTFSVNEEWLRTGVGAMFIEQDSSEEVAEMINRVLADEPETFRRRFISALSHLSSAQWDTLADFARHIVDTRAEREREMEIEREVEKEVEAYRLQLLAEKKAAGKSFPSSATGGA